MSLRIKRIYEIFDKTDGYRILVDRLWPRGLSKEKAKVDLWLKEIAPSNELRKWYNHDPEKWKEFKKRYKKELKEQQEALDKLKQVIKEHEKVTLLYSAKNEDKNNAVALKEFLS